MKKRAHKVLGIELTPANIALQADPVGKCSRYELNWASLSGPQQAKLDGHAKNRLGQS